MPRHALDPTTNTFGIAFGQGGRGSNMSTARPGSAGTTTSQDKCSECVRKKRQGQITARDSKYCERHQCIETDSSGALCTTRKKAADIRCQKHIRCQAPRCSNPRSLDDRNIPNDYCLHHKCPVLDCTEGKLHDPSRNVYANLCATHLASQCAFTNCDYWRNGSSMYCSRHVCTVDICSKRVVSEHRPFCVDHNECGVEQCQKERCQFGNEFEPVCIDHYVAPCVGDECRLKSCPPSKFCDLHSCQVKNCLKDARPGRKRPFCIDHKCSDHDCQFLRTFSESDRRLKMNDFCSHHECKSETCVKHTVPNKPYCNSHCCSEKDCADTRHADPLFGGRCRHHFETRIRKQEEERVREQLAEQARRAEREREDREAAAEQHARRARAERERERQAREDEAEQARVEEVLRQRQRQRDQGVPHRPREDPGRRQDDRRYHEQARQTERRREPVYDDDEALYEDEGYRSRPGSGVNGQGW